MLVQVDMYFIQRIADKLHFQNLWKTWKFNEFPNAIKKVEYVKFFFCMMVIGNIHGDVEKKSKEIMYLYIVFDVRSF